MKKNWKTFASGVVVGAACMMTIPAVAAGINVSAVLPGDITFKINGSNVAADSEMPVLNYNSRVYVPIRFVADQLGATVSWDANMRQVIITSPEPEVKEVIKEVPVEKIVYVKDNESTDGTVYEKLPIKQRTSDFILQITGMSIKDGNDTTKFFVTMENTSTHNIMLVQAKSKLVIDGKEYKMKSNVDRWDKTWYSDIKPGGNDGSRKDEIEGNLIFEQIPLDFEVGTLSITVRNQLNQKEETVDFNFKSAGNYAADDDD